MSSGSRIADETVSRMGVIRPVESETSQFTAEERQVQHAKRAIPSPQESLSALGIERHAVDQVATGTLKSCVLSPRHGIEQRNISVAGVAPKRPDVRSNTACYQSTSETSLRPGETAQFPPSVGLQEYDF